MNSFCSSTSPTVSLTRTGSPQACAAHHWCCPGLGRELGTASPGLCSTVTPVRGLELLSAEARRTGDLCVTGVRLPAHPSRVWGICCGQEFVAAHLPSLAGTRWLLQTAVSREGSLRRPKALLAWSCQISTSGDSDHWVISGTVLHVWSAVICPCRHGLTGLVSCAGLSELALPAPEMLS